MGRDLKGNTIADKLMYILNDDTQNSPSVDYSPFCG